MQLEIDEQQAVALQEMVKGELEVLKIESVNGLGLDEAERDRLLDLMAKLGRPMTWEEVELIPADELLGLD